MYIKIKIKTCRLYTEDYLTNALKQVETTFKIKFSKQNNKFFKI